MITPERIDEICTKQRAIWELPSFEQHSATAIVRICLNDDEEREYWDKIS